MDCLTHLSCTVSPAPAEDANNMKTAFVLFLACLGAVTPDSLSTTETDVRCGSRCLYVALKSLDIPVESTSELEESMGSPFPGGYSMTQIATAAEERGAKTLGVKTTFENLKNRPGRFTCIAFIRGNHYVLFGDVKDGTVTYVDPPIITDIPCATAQIDWQGEALLISADDLVPEADLSKGLATWKYWMAITPCVAVFLYYRFRRRRIP